jgi:hypothetical protein
MPPHYPAREGRGSGFLVRGFPKATAPAASSGAVAPAEAHSPPHPQPEPPTEWPLNPGSKFTTRVETRSMDSVRTDKSGFTIGIGTDPITTGASRTELTWATP